MRIDMLISEQSQNAGCCSDFSDANCRNASALGHAGLVLVGLGRFYKSSSRFVTTVGRIFNDLIPAFSVLQPRFKIVLERFYVRQSGSLFSNAFGARLSILSASAMVSMLLSNLGLRRTPGP